MYADQPTRAIALLCGYIQDNVLCMKEIINGSREGMYGMRNMRWPWDDNVQIIMGSGGLGLY